MLQPILLLWPQSHAIVKANPQNHLGTREVQRGILFTHRKKTLGSLTAIQHVFMLPNVSGALQTLLEPITDIAQI